MQKMTILGDVCSVSIVKIKVFLKKSRENGCRHALKHKKKVAKLLNKSFESNIRPACVHFLVKFFKKLNFLIGTIWEPKISAKSQKKLYSFYINKIKSSYIKVD